MHYLPADLKDAAARIPAPEERSGHDGRRYWFTTHNAQLYAFEKVATALEPGLDLSDTRNRGTWSAEIWGLRATLLLWSNVGSETSCLTSGVPTLVKLAEDLWRGVGGTTLRPLPFKMQSKTLEDIARRDLASMEFALAHEQTKLAIVAGCGVVEAVLIDLLDAGNPANKWQAIRQLQVKQPDLASTLAGQDPAKWSIKQLVEACGPAGLNAVPEMTVGIAKLAKDYRHYVHPNHERELVEKGVRLDVGDGSIVKALVDKVLAGVTVFSKLGEPSKPTIS